MIDVLEMKQLQMERVFKTDILNNQEVVKSDKNRDIHMNCAEKLDANTLWNTNAWCIFR